MSEFRTLDDADNLLAHYSGQPFVKGRARQLAGLGVLKISIRYRGPIGQFPITEDVPTIATEAVKQYLFDGYLTAIARPRLDVTGVKFSKKGKKETCRDILTVIEVTHDHVDFQPEPGNFIGRVVTWKDELDRTHATQNLNTGDIPVSEWLISSNDIAAYCAKSKAREGSTPSSVPEAAVATDPAPAPSTAQTEAAPEQAAAHAPEVANDWVTDAQTRAHEIIKEEKANDRYPDQLGIGDRIAREFRVAERFGANGTPLTGSYIKRHALKGITSAVGKQLSTTMGRGKQSNKKRGNTCPVKT